MTTLEKLTFTCAACGYRAKIPAHYAGRSIHCPGCRSVQPVGAVQEAGAAATGNTVVLHKVDTAVGGAVSAPSTAGAPGGNKIVFTCTACSYKGKLGAEYDGKTIRCPGCQAVQVVKGTPAPSPIVASMAADEPSFAGHDSEKLRFQCSKCGYRANIPGKYAGKPIHCPQCKDVQVAKVETDLEEATGRTVTISRVTPATVKEARAPAGAMTNVGVQFTCAVCGYTSKISPSCAGDAIYCPSCRAPQKVEWGPPADAAPAKTDAPAAGIDALAVDLSSLEVAPAPVAPAKPATAAKPAAGRPPVAQPAPAQTPVSEADKSGAEIDADSLDLFAPSKPEAKVVSHSSKQGNRRVISAGSAPEDSVDAASGTGHKAAPLRRSVGESGETAADEAAEAIAKGTTPAPPSANRKDRTASPAPVVADRGDASATEARPVPGRSSKLPLVVLLLLTFAAGGVAGFFYVKLGEKTREATDLETKVKNLDAALKSATADLAATRDELNASAAAKAAVDAKLAETTISLGEAKDALLAAQAALAEEQRLRQAAEAAVIAPSPDGKPPGAKPPASL